MTAPTGTGRRWRRLQVREPLNTWAVWVREQRHARQWTVEDMVHALQTHPQHPSPLWDDASTGRLVREVLRWEAGHWTPDRAAQHRLIATFGPAPEGITSDTSDYPSAARPDPAPTRGALADLERTVLAAEVQAARMFLINGMSEQACERLEHLADALTLEDDLPGTEIAPVDEDQDCAEW